METKYAMISQPMNGLTDEQIEATRKKAQEKLGEMGYVVMNTLFSEEWTSRENMEAEGVVQIPVKFLAKGLEKMSLCHAVYFCKGWENARGCVIEHEVADKYGLTIIHEE